MLAGRIFRPLLFLWAGLFAAGNLPACLWDYDTLAMETQRFPSAREVISGKFLRHSPEFYQWRIQDRLKRMADEPQNPGLYDDMAVAHDKLGNTAEAIRLMLEKEARFPGLYETQANLATFYIHAGEWEKSRPLIEKALAINPDAHFGRERYQLELVNYVVSLRKDGNIPLPLRGEPGDPWKNPYQRLGEGGFAAQLHRGGPAENKNYFKTVEEQQKAIQGILGMMRFANYQSPILLEVLGDVLLDGALVQNADQLAIRAYLMASRHSENPAVKEAYQGYARRIFGTHTGQKFEDLTAELENELAEGDQFYSKIREDEMRWIAEGKNADEEFSRKYYREPKTSFSWKQRWNWPPSSGELLAYVLYALIGVLIFDLARRIIRRRRNKR
jgi:tetratricopeptide (TPR) repeat protein